MKIVQKFVFLGALLGAHLFADPLDLETLPYLRTHQCSKQPYEKIVIFSAPRTGSSLVYNVFRFLFEDEAYLSLPHNQFDLNRSVFKTHRISDIETIQRTSAKVLYVVTVRNPLESSISTYRIRPLRVDDVKAFSKTLIDRQVKYIKLIEELQSAGCAVVILRYEDFEKQQSLYLLDFIQTQFNLSIPMQDIQTIVAGYSRENIYSNVESLSTFKEFLPISGFHGKHVTLESFVPPEKFVYWLNFYLNDVKPLYKKYDYFN